jgi:hypothetical protein
MKRMVFCITLGCAILVPLAFLPKASPRKYTVEGYTTTSDDAGVFEIKHHGYRITARCEGTTAVGTPEGNTTVPADNDVSLDKSTNFYPACDLAIGYSFVGQEYTDTLGGHHLDLFVKGAYNGRTELKILEER